VEVIAVVVVMALLAGAAALSFVGPLRRARANEAISRLVSFNESSRQYAARFGRDTEMVVSLAESSLTAQSVGGDRGGRRTTRLPDGVRIDRVRVAGQSGRSAAFGEVTVPCSRLGLTPTFAVRLVGPGLDRWVVMPGLGGGARQVNDEREVDHIFDAIEQAVAAGDDAR
jgi:type II secretory pathway pseudopilin PulG